MVACVLRVTRRMLESGDDILAQEACSLVSGLDAAEVMPRHCYLSLTVSLQGVLLIAKNNVYFLEGYRKTDAGELEQTAPATILDAYEPMLKWAYDQIRDVRPGRYLLQNRALEIFGVAGNNTLLAMRDRPRRDAACDRILALVPPDPERVSGLEALREGGLGAALPSLPGFGPRSATQRWEAGEMSNFQYLMHLNTQAGRSYNDLNQYPVFPWVLASYEGDELDLDDPCSYRDLGQMRSTICLRNTCYPPTLHFRAAC